MMFPVPQILENITIGDYRNNSVSVQSGRYGKEKIHFIAPGDVRAEVESEMTDFLRWLNANTQAEGYIRAAVAKFHFVTIHPFDDGNTSDATADATAARDLIDLVDKGVLQPLGEGRGRRYQLI